MQMCSETLIMIVSEFFCILILFITRCYSAMEGFIEGGQYAKIESFPHSVYLLMVCREHQTCGGSILTQHIILTAGHCFDGCSKKHEIYAYAGSEDTDLMLVADKVTNYIIHKQYDKFELLNDIALGTLKSSLPLGETVKRVIIARSFPDVMMARTAGWGIVNDNTYEETEILKMVTQVLQPKGACNQVLNKGMMCARNSYKNHPSLGDAGIALISKNGQQIGLVSHRHPDKKDAVIYMNVSYYYDWIETQSRQLYCSGRKFTLL